MMERPENKVFLLLSEEVTSDTRDNVVKERLQTILDDIHNDLFMRCDGEGIVETAGDGGELECDGRVERKFGDEEMLHKRDIEWPVIAEEIDERKNSAELAIKERNVVGCYTKYKELRCSIAERRRVIMNTNVVEE